MRQSGYSLLGISATSLLFVPWALKFLWAPYVDRHGPRPGWLLPLPLATALGAALLAMLDLSQSLRLGFAALVLFHLPAATPDIPQDGLAVHLLQGRESGLPNGHQ